MTSKMLPEGQCVYCKVQEPFKAGQAMHWAYADAQLKTALQPGDTCANVCITIDKAQVGGSCSPMECSPRGFAFPTSELRQLAVPSVPQGQLVQAGVAVVHRSHCLRALHVPERCRGLD